MVNRKRRVDRVGEEIGNPAALIVEAVDTSILLKARSENHAYMLPNAPGRVGYVVFEIQRNRGTTSIEERP